VPGLRAMLRGGTRVVGTFVKLPVLESIDLVAEAGFDFGLVDLEHAQMDEADALRLIRHARARGLATLVRIAALEGGSVNRLLEAGASGMQLSTVRTAATARGLREACHYPPKGRRSVSLAHPVASYGAVPLIEYLARAAADAPLAIGQIETAATESPLAEIARELDALFIGTVDLTVDMGLPGQASAPAVAARMADIKAAADAAGVPVGVFAPNRAAATALAAGTKMLVLGSDVQLLGESLRAAAADLGALRSL